MSSAQEDFNRLFYPQMIRAVQKGIPVQDVADMAKKAIKLATYASKQAFKADVILRDMIDEWQPPTSEDSDL